MRKIKNKGFMLAETLIVTTFVSGVLLFLFIQFTNLNKNYNYSYKYNTVEDLYAIEDIKKFIKSDIGANAYITSNITTASSYKEITDCSIFTNIDYCKKLFNLEDIKNVIITANSTDYNIFSNGYDVNLINFIRRIKPEGTDKYRLIVVFNNYTYATLRF